MNNRRMTIENTLGIFMGTKWEQHGKKEKKKT
jgi:hypothetical protein